MTKTRARRMSQESPPSSASEHQSTAERLTRAGVRWSASANAGTAHGDPEALLRHQFGRLSGELQQNRCNVSVGIDPFLQQLKGVFAARHDNELLFQEKGVGSVGTLIVPTHNLRLEQSFTVSSVDLRDSTLFAPSHESKCDIALVCETLCCVAVVEAKCGKQIYDREVHDRLSAEGTSVE